MEFAEADSRFIAPHAERVVALAGMLAARGVGYSVVRTGSSRHVVVHLGRGRARLAFVAHYDRLPGSPGMLDNSCACIQLAEFAARYKRMVDSLSPLLVLFTDAEEAPGVSGAADQGAFALAQALRLAVGSGDRPPPALVFDVTGRGDRLVMSKAPEKLLARNGLADSPLAAGYGDLVSLALRAATMTRNPAPAHIELPWSDDLGLMLGGIPALALGVLPEPELAAYENALSSLDADEGSKGRAGLMINGPPIHELFGSAWPRTWSYLHSPEDGKDLAEEGAFAIMAAFLDAVARSM